MVAVVVNSESLDRSATGSITGQIHIARPAGSFPEESWNDFPVVILTWWVVGLGLIASGDRNSFVGHFMEGPYSFRIHTDAGDIARVTWDGCSSVPDTVSIAALLQSTVTAGRIVLASCRAKNWSSNDLESLEHAILATRPNNSFKPTPHRGVGHVPTLR